MADSKPGAAVMAAIVVFAAAAVAAESQERVGAAPDKLLPQVPGWTLVEPPRSYLPASLFEYINGAAESYLSYGFRELAVADYKSDSGPATLTVEIYDLGESLSAFGIYSVERYPGSKYLDIGAQGYFEEGTLNFFAGPNYIKLMCFDCGQAAEAILNGIAGDIEKRLGAAAGRLPAALAFFPKEGMVANSEKYVRQNVLGYGFLHDGYLAGYQASGQEFELFIIAGRDEAEARKMLDQYLAAQAKNGAPVAKSGPGYHIADRYARNVFLAATGRYLAGAMRVNEGAETLGMKYLEELLASLGNS